MSSTRQMVLSALFQPHGHSKSSWRHPDSRPSHPTDVRYYVEAAQLLERGMFDLFFIADTPAVRTENLDAWAQSPLYMNALEPVTLLSAVAMATEHIGLGATVSSSFFEPFNIARQFASLDHISRGRAAWNVVTSANDYAARNFGLDRLPPHAERYAKARESLQVVKAYWDTWEDDAFVYDKPGARLFDKTKQHPVSHDGEFFRVHGGINVARSPQGHPVIIQAGASEPGKEFAAETAEIVFGTGTDLGEAKEFYDDLKGRMPRFGRGPDQLKVLSGFSAVIGESEAHAAEKRAEMEALVPIEARLIALVNDLETDLFDLPLDEPVPLERIPVSANHHRVYFEEIAGLIRSGITLREVAMRYTRSSAAMTGTAVQVADFMTDWVRSGGSDGFMLTFQHAPRDIHDFVEQVVPILQDRGLVRRDWPGRTMRENLGLARPANRYATA
ncbi:LLM class flavin-dependent oxidoreductase [Kineococcus sp. GCM10028916]|uniref:LLM class flavin-dependent oxidoreductase n=1 Tax=Kineococcus sp. GCM10028916 TaxID=3273394 RepID=UPI00363DB841